MIWTCPACGREFGRNLQSHVCAPAISADAYFEGRPLEQRAIFEAVAGQLTAFGPVILEPVGVGILFKRSRTFVELRGRSRWMVLSFMLGERLNHPRITRVVGERGRFYHFTRLTSAGDVDATVRGWLSASYDFAGSLLAAHPKQPRRALR